MSAAEIERLEDERYRAVVEKDVATLERILHDDFQMVHSSGLSDTKASYIGGIRDGVLDYSRIDRSDQDVKAHGDTGVVFNRMSISIKVQGIAKDIEIRTLAAWHKSDSGWQLIAFNSANV